MSEVEGALKADRMRWWTGVGFEMGREGNSRRIER